MDPVYLLFQLKKTENSVSKDCTGKTELCPHLSLKSQTASFSEAQYTKKPKLQAEGLKSLGMNYFATSRTMSPISTREKNQNWCIR